MLSEAERKELERDQEIGDRGESDFHTRAITRWQAHLDLIERPMAEINDLWKLVEELSDSQRGAVARIDRDTDKITELHKRIAELERGQGREDAN